MIPHPAIRNQQSSIRNRQSFKSAIINPRAAMRGRPGNPDFS
jgi:hypothetical protein